MKTGRRKHQHYQASHTVQEAANDVLTAMKTGVIPDDLEEKEAYAQVEAYKGMSIQENAAYVENFKQSDAEGFTNLKRGDAFYLPMLEVIKYLQKNDFTVYICSGTNRFTVRNLIEDKVPIPPRQVIGSDSTIKASGQGDAVTMHYNYQEGDQLLFGDELIIKNVKMSKVTQIQQELGQKPVLVFGNSTGDVPMALYCTTDNPYKAEAFFVLCDDIKREQGNLEKAENIQNICNEYGWNTISMEKDWETIYGNQVGITR